METLYDKVNLKCAKLITQSYSTSFSMGIRVFAKKFRSPIYAIYSFARYADEIVDTFHDSDKARLLNEFEEETYKAIDQALSLNPVLHAFQLIVNAYDIDKDLIHAFITSMKMDLKPVDYDKATYEKYIYGSAEVIGLMCLKVFTAGHEGEYEELKEEAKALGAAFQKINFLRDIKSDYQERGRVYFPDTKFDHFSEERKQEILDEIGKDFSFGLEGIKKLPKGAKFGVYLAYVYYINLYSKIKNASILRIKEERIRVRNRRKLVLLAKSAIKLKFNLI